MDKVVDEETELAAHSGGGPACGGEPSARPPAEPVGDTLVKLLLGTVSYAGLLVLWAVFHPAGETLFRTVDNIGQTVGPLFLCIYVAFDAARSRRSVHHPGFREALRSAFRTRAVLLILLSPVFWTLGEALLTYTELRSGTTPQFSISDLFYLVANPCLIAGILNLPRRPLPIAARTRIFCDGLVTMVAMVTFSWFFLLGPVVLSATTAPLDKVVGAIYPLADLVFIYCLIAMASRAIEPDMRGVVGTLFGAVVILVVGNSVYAYQTLHGVYRTGTPLDAAWPFAAMLLAIGAHGARLVADERTAHEHDGADTVPFDLAPPPVWRSLVSYSLVPAVGILFLYVAVTRGDKRLEMGVYVGSACLIGLTLLRQVLAILENAHLYRSLQSAFGELATKNRQTIEHAAHVERLNTELRTMQNELVQSAKLASLGTLAAGVAHELNQPLAIIRGITQQLCQEESVADDLLADLRLVEGQTGRMMKIIQHLRVFSRAGTQVYQRVDLHKVVDDCLVLIGAQLKAHNIHVVFEFCDQPAAVMGDANEIEQVFLNLMTNARDALDSASQERDGAAEPVEKVITVRTTLRDGEVVLEFSDNGPGVAPEIAERVFDPFFTTKDPGKGTGLGLSITHSIIQKHHGTILVKSDRDAARTGDGPTGATFVITMPSADAAEAASADGEDTVSGTTAVQSTRTDASASIAA